MSSSDIHPERRIYCNRTLNLNKIKALGFDMDYTLVHYKSDEWEARAFEHTKARLLDRGYPVAHFSFDPHFAELGLIIDQELGNLVKANRFGHVRRACHGTEILSHRDCRKTYQTAPIDLSEKRWQFMNTLFSLSEASIYMQMVDLFDQDKLPSIHGFEEIYRIVRSSLDATHMEGKLKAEIQANPDAFVELDEKLASTLLDLKSADKKLVVITNSEWSYTNSMLSYILERYLPQGMKWRDVFDLVIVRARKPSFFSANNAALELVDSSGLYRPHESTLNFGEVYMGGSAHLVEESLGVAGDEILYFGDHIYADVHVSKELFRWRTALVVRELENELIALEDFANDQKTLHELMLQKDLLEQDFATLRLARLHAQHNTPHAGPMKPPGDPRPRMKTLRQSLLSMDEKIAPLASRASKLGNSTWGPAMRCGNDKSHLARQIERYADIYTSRVSNLGAYTPFAYLRAARGSLPHDA